MSGFVSIFAPLSPTLPPAPDLHVSIGSVSHFPMTAFDVTSGSYGSVGHAAAHTTRKMLDAQGIDLVQIASGGTQVPFLVYAETETIKHTQIFDGDVLSVEWDMDTDMVVVHARDHAGVFVDQKRILARDAQALTKALTPLSPGQLLTPTGVSTMNRTVSQVVTDIASEFGYKPVINMGQGTDVLTGALYGSSDHTYMTIPQNLWSILQTLARDSGNEIYTTPDRKLVFGEPGAGLPTLHVSWNQQLTDDQLLTNYPIARLQITHNPRRNATFRVLVTSYDPTRAQVTLGRATVIGDNLATSLTPAGTYTGSQALGVDNQLLSDAQTKGQGSASDLSHTQLYTFHWDGLSTDDANARAAAIAADISKRLLLAKFVMDGLPTITPTQRVQISGNLPPAFSGNTWYVSGFMHKFAMPQERQQTGFGTGYVTEVQCLDLPTAALAATTR
jgi:hypothetical protein